VRRLSREQRAAILTLLVEGNSARATARLTGHHLDTVLRFMVSAGQACARAHQHLVRDLTCRRIEVDELWAFVGMKQRRVPTERAGEFGIGDVWTFTSIDPDTKLVPAWLIGERGERTAQRFLLDLGRRINGRFQLTSDGAYFYRQAVREALGPTVDYAQLVKICRNRGGVETTDDDDGEEPAFPEPGRVRTYRIPISGNPDPKAISTSIVERHNRQIRMGNRRYTRRTDAYSKKAFNLSCSVALMMFAYNFVRPHMTLTERANGKPTTPAMAAGLMTRPWAMAEVVRMVEARETSAIEVARRGKDRRSAR